MAQSGKKKGGRSVTKKASADDGGKMVSIKIFFSEVRTEFGKISWPGRKQTFSSTVVVIVMSTLIAFYLGAVDLVVGKLVGYILH